MALISPGVQVTVSDESQYTPTAAGTIPYILLATAQDKLNPQGTTATGTTSVNADKVVTITSQRELISTFGYPTFQQDASGNPIHGSELNEYGLLAAYSALGVANRVLVQRANVDLAQLAGTAIRPTGEPADGVYWLDTANTDYGLFEFSSVTGGFTKVSVTSITDTALLDGIAPKQSYGAIGEYAVNNTITTNPIYYKRWDNTWALISSDEWMQSRPTIVGTVSNPTDLAIGQKLVINGSNVELTGATIQSAAVDISNVGNLRNQGIVATVSSAGQLEIRINSLASGTGNLLLHHGNIKIQSGLAVGAASDCAVKLGLFTAAEIAANVHLTGKTLLGPATGAETFSDYRTVPAWKATDTTPRPTGSVWYKTSATGNGANWVVNKYSALVGAFAQVAAPLYESDKDAIFQLDPVGGGAGISVGTVYIKYNATGDSHYQPKFRPMVKNVSGIMKVTGTVPGSPLTFTAGNKFVMEVSDTSSASQDYITTITLSGTTSTSFVSDILAANIPNVTAIVEASGAISISHLAGGTIQFEYVAGQGTPLTTAGLINDSKIQVITAGEVYLASPWTPLDYTYSAEAPYSDPADGTLWYYNNPLEVDIMINKGSTPGWVGYRELSSDARGYNLQRTDPNGPILSATTPTVQSDGTTTVKAGELWIDTSDLENFPVIRRYNGSAWELLDNTDQVSLDGVVFADARWSYNGTTDPITDSLPLISDLALSHYIDDDAPDYRLYPRGALLVNTRRSGFNVKRFESQWFADPATFTGSVVPTVKSAWVSHSGVNAAGVPYFGHSAQRNTVVEALKSSIESSVSLREEQIEFNLIATPGYPELISNMITLNNDRKQTAFIIGDSPLSLTSSSTNIASWTSNENLALDNGLDGLVSSSEYLGVYYPSGFTTNLDGNSVAVPASHMMLRTFIRSDNQSYQWFAPAGVRRGLIDNASSIGYVDVADGSTFKSIGVTVGLRDVLYTNRVNPLTVLPGVGLVAYGQKTRAATTSAMDRVNVARLVAYLRLVLDKVARPFIFEPNDTITRNQVKAGFEAVLNDIVAKRGIYDYLVVCDETNNTPDRIDRNELYIDIAIEPVKAIEFIYIPVRLKGTGDIAAGL